MLFHTGICPLARCFDMPRRKVRKIAKGCGNAIRHGVDNPRAFKGHNGSLTWVWCKMEIPNYMWELTWSQVGNGSELLNLSYIRDLSLYITSSKLFADHGMYTFFDVNTHALPAISEQTSIMARSSFPSPAWFICCTGSSTDHILSASNLKTRPLIYGTI